MATPISQIPLGIKGQTTCIHHKGRQLEFYCEKCRELVCPKCLSSIHKCHPVCELSEITHQKETYIKNLIDRTEKNYLVQIGKCITTTLLKDNTSTFEKLSQKLKMQTDKLKQVLDMLTEQTLSLYHKMEEDNNTKLIKKYKQDLEMYEMQLKQQIQECKAALQRGSHIQIYDTLCDIHSPIYSLPIKPVLGTANFTPNKNPQDHLKKALGKVTTSGQGQTLTDQDQSVSTSDDQGQHYPQQQQSGAKVKKAVTTYKLLPQTKVAEEWKSPSYIDSICPTTDGQVWTKYNNTLTLLDGKGNVIQEVNHNVRISDISPHPPHTHCGSVIQKTTSWSWYKDDGVHRFSTKKVPWCICITASNHFIVGMTRHISKFTSDGKMVCTTMATVTGKQLMCSPDSISECPVTRDVAVADFSSESDGGDEKRHVVVIDTDFKELFVYRGDIPSTYKPTPQTGGKPFYPSGVVYESVGNLIIGDQYNYRVLLSVEAASSSGSYTQTKAVHGL